MAILKGFPASNTISPTIRIAENDLSFIAPEIGTAKAGIVGFCSKGPINVPTLVSTTRELHRVFGYPHPETSDPYLIYAAEQVLLVANQVYIVRVADEDAVSDEAATKASVDIFAAGGLIEIISDTAAPYTFSDNAFFKWKLNGVLSSKELVVLAGTYATADDLAEELNDQLVAEDGITFTSTSDQITVQSTFSYGPNASIEFVSIKNAMYGGAVVDGNVSGLGTGMTQAVISGTATKYPNNSYTSAGVYNFSSVASAGLVLEVVVDGTDDVNIDNVVQVIDLSDFAGLSTNVSSIVSEINQQITDGVIPGGFVAEAYNTNSLRIKTNHHGVDARILVKSDSTADTIFGFANTTSKGVTPSGVTGSVSVYTFGKTTGSSNGTSLKSFTIEADSAGIEGNNTQVRLTNDVRNGTFIIDVYNNGAQVEVFSNLTKDQASRYYVETYIADNSDFITVIDNTATTAPPANTATGSSHALVGGSDGIPSDPDDQDTLIIGNDVAFTGVQALSEPEQIDIDLLAIPGHSSTDVVLAGLDLCLNKRQDCFYVVDPPFGLTVNEITDWHNGRHSLNSTQFDNDFGGLFWPWVKIRDTYNKVDVWCPPSGSILATITRSDNISAPWYAFAGINRGVVPNITDVFSRPSAVERDLMYGYANAINPIVQFSDTEGFLIWGNKTLQRRSTALNRINVRRMMIAVEKQIRRDARVILFDPHDETSRQRFISIADSVLADVQQRRGITDYIIQCDEELNPPDVIDRGELRAKIGIQPTRAIEFIFIEFSLHRTGSFAENTEF